MRGTCEDRVKLLFRLLDRPVDKTIKSSELLGFIEHVIETAAQILGSKSAKSGETSASLALSLMHDLLFPGESPKSSLEKRFVHDEDFLS